MKEAESRSLAMFNRSERLAEVAGVGWMPTCKTRQPLRGLNMFNRSERLAEIVGAGETANAT